MVAASSARALLLASGRSALRNEFVALRHGWSKANEAGLIISRIERGRLSDYGLHAKGRAQAAAVTAPLRTLAGGRDVVVLASDFSRTLETAEIAAGPLGCDIVATPALRERDFGDYEAGPNTAYDAVWEEDAVAASHASRGVEPVLSVLARAAAAVKAVDEKCEDSLVLLVSHGDCLQILQTAFADVDPRFHRALPHFETCELRPLPLV